MQPDYNAGFRAFSLTHAIFTLDKARFSEALDENVEFISHAKIHQPDDTVIEDKRSFAGKEQVVNVLAQRLFDITKKVEIVNVSVQASTTNSTCARVEFETNETKEEKTAEKTALIDYHYVGHYLVHFTETAEKVIKVSQVQLTNERTIKS